MITRVWALRVLALAFTLALFSQFPAVAETVVFRDGKTIEVTQAPCLADDSVHLSVSGLPTPVAYARNLVDEARTFHANPRVPVARLFAPCSATGPVGAGVAPPSLPAEAAPRHLYAAPSAATSGQAPNESTSGQCAAITKKGTRCSRKAQPGRTYCYQH